MAEEKHTDRDESFAELVEAFRLPLDTKAGEQPIEMRCLTLADVAQLNSVVNKNIAHIGPWLPWAKKENSVEESEDFVKGAIVHLKARSAVQYGIFVGGALAGCVGTHPVEVTEHDTKASIGYWLDKDHNGKGIVTRCVATLIESPILWHVFKLDRVEIAVDERNAASRAIPERLGVFTNIGKQPRRECCDCVPIVYEMRRPSYPEIRKNPFFARITVDEQQHIELRILDESHCEVLFRKINDNLGDLPWVISALDGCELTAEFVHTDLVGGWRVQMEKREAAWWSIFVGDELVGQCGVHRVDKEEKRTDIGYWLDKSHRGKGIVTKCVEAICKGPVLWSIMDLDTVEVWCDSDNVKSRGVPERLGFENLGAQTRSNSTKNPIDVVYRLERPLLYTFVRPVERFTKEAKSCGQSCT